MFGKTIENLRENVAGTIEPQIDKLLNGIWVLCGLMLVVIALVVANAN